MSGSGVRPAELRDLEACAQVLARAFQEDPGAVIFDPDPERRAAMLPGFFRAFVAASLAEAGDLVVAGDPAVGIACWFGPDTHGPSPEALAANGFGDVLDGWGPDASERILAMTGEIEEQHDRLIAGPHLRLDFFGVDPACQGSGIGSALVEHGHRIADARGLPCYLETFTETNVRYYERRGYRIIDEYAVGDVVPVSALVRQPRT
jgi:ribosomal protein S18 acetylase RimI-like enzyme